MSTDYCDDLMPRNAPKPAPLNEVTAKPTVPEVSLLLDQEKNKSFHLSNPAKSSEAKSRNSEQSERDQNKALEILDSNQFESYNTWKAKNALALHTITGSVGKKEATTVHTDRSRNLKGERSKQIKDREFYHTQGPEVVVTSPMVVKKVPNKMYSSQASKPSHENNSHVRENFPPRLVYNGGQQHPVSPSKLGCNRQSTSENYAQSRDNGLYPHERNVCQFSKEQVQRQNLPVPTFLHTPQHMVPGAHDQPIHSCGLLGASRLRSEEIPNLCNKEKEGCQISNSCRNTSDHGQCQCSKDEHRTDQGGTNFMKRDPIFSRETYQMFNPMLVSPQNMGLLNNQTVIELYHIIHIQNEQILMLQNQVKEMLKIHLDCGKNSSEQNIKCGNCSCVNVNNHESKSNKCGAKESPVVCVSDQKKVSCSDECNVSPKRSIGIMTTLIEEDSGPQNVQSNVVVNTKNLKIKPKKSKKKQEVQQEYISPSSYKLKNPSYHGPPKRKEKRNRQDKLSIKKTSKEESNGRNQEKNSFTLNEAELPVGTDSEDDDMSPYNSVNFLDYCTISDDSSNSNTAESSSDDDDSEEETGTEGYSSDPQLGWTFYNQVVGQVNNILKKKPTPPRHERGYPSRVLPNHMYTNRGHDMENNWSKRVTFDGPSTEDSENMLPGMMYTPRNQVRMGQDFRPNGGPMMQDFRMYNIADGNSNLSFATLRRLEHYNVVPPSYGVNMPDQSFNNVYQKRGKKSHKKNTKYREPETYHHTTTHQKKKSWGPSSKLLDITAIKQQPKLC